MDKVKVNLGCGSEILKGYINVDVRKLPGVDVVCDLHNLSQFENNSWDEVRMSHTIEHFTEKEAIDILIKIYHKMKVGAIISLYCPNAAEIVNAYSNGRIPIEEFSRLLFGNQKYKEELHKMALDKNRLTKLVEKVGFKVIGHNPRPKAYAYDLGIQAIK